MDSYYDDSENKKYLKLTTNANDRRKDDIEAQEQFKTTISTKNLESSDYINKTGQAINPGESSTYDVTGKVGQYYGYVMDEAGNKGTCNHKVDMIAGEDPKCSVLDTADGKWNSKDGTNKYKTLYAECYVAGGINSIKNTSKIVAEKSSGTISVTEDTAGNNDTENKVRFKITYTPKDNQYYKDEHVVIQSGLVTDSIGTANTEIKSSNVKVDSVKPIIKYTPLTTKQSGGWYKPPFKLKMSCSDNSQSGVKTFKVNGTAVANPKTITRKTAANPGTWETSCTDKAGNSNSDSKPYYVKENTPDPVCGVKRYKSCRNSACGCQTYKSCENSSCSCATYNRGKSCGCAKSSTSCDYTTKCTSICTVMWNAKYPSCPSSYSSVSTSYSQCNAGQTGAGIATYKFCRKCKKCTTKCTTYKRCAAAGCAVRNSCRHSSCECKTYNSCRKSACGVENYETCYHF